MKLRTKVTGGALAAVLVSGVGIAACNPDDAVEPPPGGEKTQTTPTTERKDLLEFKIDDRSTAGINDIWVTWEIKNTSGEKSNYTWDWEAVAPNGDRVESSTEFVENVRPGQLAKGEMPTTLDVTNVKINITSFDRTAAY